MAFELFTGDRPFREVDAPMAVLMHHATAPIPRVEGIDPRIADWIEALLAKDPAQRTRSAAAAWDEYEEIALDLLGPRWRRDARLTHAPGERLADEPTPTALPYTPPPPDLPPGPLSLEDAPPAPPFPTAALRVPDPAPPAPRLAPPAAADSAARRRGLAARRRPTRRRRPPRPAACRRRDLAARRRRRRPRPRRRPPPRSRRQPTRRRPARRAVARPSA